KHQVTPNQNNSKEKQLEHSFKEKLKARVLEINKAISNYKFGDSPKELYEPIRYVMALGGKRVRPLLVLLGYEIWHEDWTNDKILLPAAGVEGIIVEYFLLNYEFFIISL